MDILVAFCPEFKYQSQWIQLQIEQMQYYACSDAILIPSKSTLYISPITSSKIHGHLKSGLLQQNELNIHDNDKQQSEAVCSAFTHNFYKCSPSQELFTFNNPNCNEKCLILSNERCKTLKFHITQDCNVTGFAGFFEAVLYADIIINDQIKLNESNWRSIPITYYPLYTPSNLQVDDEFEVRFWFRDDKFKKRFWYEWCILSPNVSHIHNLKGSADSSEYGSLAQNK